MSNNILPPPANGDVLYAILYNILMFFADVGGAILRIFSRYLNLPAPTFFTQLILGIAVFAVLLKLSLSGFKAVIFVAFALVVIYIVARFLGV